MTKPAASGWSAWLPRLQRDAIGADDADATLITRLRAADRDAVAEVYHAHHNALRTFAQRITGDDATAEDLVQDVFVALPSLVQKFRGESLLRTFLIGVAVRLSRRHVHTAARRRALLAKYARVESDMHTPPCFDELARMYRALDSLPLAQRTAFVLCEVEERSADEAAALLGIPAATVRTRCFHARHKLRAQLARQGMANDGPTRTLGKVET